MAVTHKRLLWRQLQIDFCCIHSKLYCFSFLDGRQDWTLSPYVLDDFLHILRRRGARKADSGLNGDTFGRSDIALEDKR